MVIEIPEHGTITIIGWKDPGQGNHGPRNLVKVYAPRSLFIDIQDGTNPDGSVNFSPA